MTDFDLASEQEHNYVLPAEGGAMLWLCDNDFSPVAESCARIDQIIEFARNNGERWIQFTLLGDASSDRRPCFARPDAVRGMTYLTADQVEEIESEV